MTSGVDTFVTLVFTVVAVLFAGLGIVATKGSDESSFVSSPVWIAAVAHYFALKSYSLRLAQSRETNVSSDQQAMERLDSRIGERSRLTFIEILIAVIIVLGSLGFHVWHDHDSARNLAGEKTRVDKLEQQNGSLDNELKVQRIQFDAKIQSLEKQIELLRSK